MSDIQLRIERAKQRYSREFDEAKIHRDESGKFGHKDDASSEGEYPAAKSRALSASDHAYELSKSERHDKGFQHGVDAAYEARQHARNGDHLKAAESHRQASKQIAKGRQGWFGDKGGKAHDKMELAHNDAADAHNEAHRLNHV